MISTAKTCGECIHWNRPYEAPNHWMAFRYWLYKLFAQRYSDGTIILNWCTFTCPSGKYRNRPGIGHWDIYPACKKFFKSKEKYISIKGVIHAKS